MVIRRRWIYDPPDAKKVNWVVAKKGLPRWMATVLVKRGYSTKKAIREYLEPQLSHLENPFLMKDMLKAASRVVEAVKKGEKIMVFGDYDADGVASAAIMYRALKSLNADVEVHINNWFVEMVGLSPKFVGECARRGVSVLITVDTGITSYEAAEAANIEGIDLIITDHHEPQDKLPRSFALIDPKLKDTLYPFSNLAGAGVALKFALALDLLTQGDCIESVLKELFELAAIGTVADVVPLVSENRVIVKNGLKFLSMTKNIGLRALLRKVGLEPGSKITEEDVSFKIAPRINAAGRMGHPEVAFRLLVSSDDDEAGKLVEELENYNRERKEIEERTTVEIMGCIESSRFKNDKVLVLGSDRWYKGVVGVVASKLCRYYHKPVIIFSINREEGVGYGSGRSLLDWNLFSLVKGCDGFLESFGGHSVAVGMVIKSEKIPEFREAINRLARKRHNDDEDFDETFIIDVKTDLSLFGRNFKKFYEMLKPFGVENPKPIFWSEGLKVKRIYSSIGGNYWIELSDSSRTMTFFLKYREMELLPLKGGEVIDVLYTVGWLKEDEVKFIIEDYKIH